MQKKSKIKKEKWGKPKLIILTRGKPEERALESCKSDPSGLPGPDSAYEYCRVYDPLCAICSTQPAS